MIDIKNPEIAQIVKKKYPIEILIEIEGLDRNRSRFFTDDFNNFIYIEKEEEEEEEEFLDITFFCGSFSPTDAFEERNTGVFFIVKNLFELQQLIDLNLVYYYNTNSEMQKEEFEKLQIDFNNFYS